MDVRCSRCGTEYEFDDALVSERGTTVKCTNCGHQFKVFAPGASDNAPPERWIVRKASGRELVYTSLRELQRAIVQRQVGPTDMLSRGRGQPLRSLGSIAELEPFFDSQPRDRVGGPVSTLLGISPAGAPAVEADTVVDPPAFASTMRSASRPPMTTPSGGIAVHPHPPEPRPGPEPAPRAPQPGPPPAPYAREESEPATMPRNPRPPQPAPEHALGATLPVDYEPSRPAAGPAQPPPPVEPVPTAAHAHQPAPPPHVTPTPSAVSEAYRSYDETAQTDSGYIPGVPPRRRSATRWIVGIVVLGGLSFVAVTVGQKYLGRLSEMTQTGREAPADDRVASMLAEGRKLLNEGDFDGAKEHFDKASVLSEKDPAVRAALARLEAARADIHWLAIKLLPPDDEAARQAEQRQLEARVDKVTRAVRAAMEVAPNDPAVVRAEVDALRLEGKIDEARQRVTSLQPTASDPKTAYVLAALDLAEPSPVWATVIDRLRTAASVEGALGRARAALVYALASSGSIAEAKHELDRIKSAKTPHPLALALERFIDRQPAPDGGTADELAASPEPEESREETANEETAAGAAEEPAGAGSMDFRKLLEKAAAAKASGDLSRAERLYRLARERDPGNIEALAGLGDVARMRGDTAQARNFYDGVLRANPSYLPTLIARADMKWAAGDRPGALEMYRRVLRQAGPGTPYGQRAQAKIQQAESSSAQAASPEPAAAQPAAPTPPTVSEPSPPTEPEAPQIDTSDLPGFNQ